MHEQVYDKIRQFIAVHLFRFNLRTVNLLKEYALPPYSKLRPCSVRYARVFGRRRRSEFNSLAFPVDQWVTYAACRVTQRRSIGHTRGMIDTRGVNDVRVFLNFEPASQPEKKTMIENIYMEIDPLALAPQHRPTA